MKRLLGTALALTLLYGSVHAQPTCTGVWGTPLVNQTFGQGTATDNWYGPLNTYAPGASTSTTFVGAAGPVGGVLSDGFSGLAKVPSASGQGNWVSTPDHTGNTNGLMFLINAPSTAATVFFEYVMDDLCPNTTLKLSVWILNANMSSLTTNPTYQYPNMTLKAVDAITNVELGSSESGDVAADAAWHQYSVVFSNGTSSSVKLQLVNNSVGSGFGNDLAIDDITVQPCVPVSHVLPKIDTLICQNASLNFTANVTASPYNPPEYQWQYSTDGGTTWLDQGAPSASTSYTFTTGSLAAGSYLIRYKTGPQGATANSNCIAISDTSKVTISSPPVTPGINYIDHYCTGTAFVPFTIVSGTNIKWYEAPGDPPMAAAPVVNTNAPGVYTWYASQTTLQGCESPLLPVTVTVVQNPIVDFNYTLGPGCSNDTIYLQNTAQFANSYRWDFGDGLTDTAKNPVHIYNDQGIYNIRLIASGSGCKDSTVKIIDINHPLQAAFNTSPDVICVGGFVNFINGSTTSVVHGTAPSWFWDFGDGSTTTQESPSHTFNTPGEYHVLFVARNGIPCTDTARTTILVDSVPHLLLSKSDTSICQGQITTFFADYTQNGLTDLQWNFGENADLLEQKSPGVRHAFELPGTYTITVNGYYRVCPNASATIQMLVKPMPHIDLGADTSICLDAAPLTLTDAVNAADPKATWRWSSGEKTASIQVRHDGRYTATVTIDQCSSSDDVVVTKDCYTDVPNSFTPNGDGVNDYFFPRQYLSKGVSGFAMTVYNRWGQKVFETENPNGRGWDGRFNDKAQPTGVYIYAIKVVLKNGRAEEYTGNVTLLR
ncbi:gliding motility-associated C-terminal domain-containing protein [Taibaiella koreensis]|uniref:gliding motility-associated C-terminal domain-containing protein n=1 Tax=Taibaiella koreensis TaxID=1268548 RepID=UPI000E59C256|nr:gliding motility-associated C-terminal domain-containing protein [Taibaiella koreensis]